MRAAYWMVVGGVVAAGVGCSRAGGGAGTADAGVALLLGPENVTRVERGTVESGPTLAGTLQPVRDAELRAQSAGEVIEVRVERGQRVLKGQLLVRIKDEVQQDALASARAAASAARTSLRVSKQEFERAKKQFEGGAISRQDFELAQRTYASRQAELSGASARESSAQTLADYTQITAPFDGVVSDRPVNLGDMVQPGMSLLTVVDPYVLRLDAAVPVADSAQIHANDEVEFTIQSQGDRKIRGRIHWLSPAVDPKTRQVRLLVDVPNQDGKLLAGLFAEGRVALQTVKALTADTSAVHSVGGRTHVLRIKDGRVEDVAVRVGLTDDVSERVELLSGVSEGDLLIAGNAADLPVGARVQLSQPPNDGNERNQRDDQPARARRSPSP